MDVMKYMDALKQSMEMLSQDKNRIFLGYNICFGSQAYGTLKDVPKEKKIETPVAENLMVGLAIGMALEGYKPVLFFERHDFMLNALDGIANHLDKINELTHGKLNAPIIIRATVGSKKPLYPGIQHIQDHTCAFKKMVHFPIYEPKTSLEVIQTYEKIRDSQEPTMVIERKELYHDE